MTESSQPGHGYVLAGRYLLEEKLGRGGMSTVWRARDQVLDREVAVKVVNEMEDAEITAERFRRETRVTAALNHPNIVTVFDAGVDNDRAFLVMELLPGATLADDLRTRGALPFDEIRSIALQVTAALGAAHEAGLVHRDVKPGNIARTADGGVKVLDFGITHILDEAVNDSGSPLTATGAVIGTAAYLAPEQARGQRVDQRADLYALGCVLYALITGRPPFQGPTAVSTMMAHATEPVPDLKAARPDVPAGLAAVVTA
ncbi:serine/threonine-protein kinase, partial [Tessaracoccus lubricantis]